MKRFKPVSFKATFVDRRGSRKQDISLSLNRQTSEGAAGSPVSSAHSFHVSEDTDVSGDFQQHSVSAHENRRIQEQIKWTESRDRLVDLAIENSFLPNGTVCVWCHKTTAVLRCTYCGPQTFLCLDCAKNLHCSINTYHVPELWKVLQAFGIFVIHNKFIIIFSFTHPGRFVKHTTNL